VRAVRCGDFFRKTRFVVSIVDLGSIWFSSGGPRSVALGEYLLKLAGRLSSKPEPALPETKIPVLARRFAGRDASHARRVAIGWWFEHRAEHGLFVRDFLARCRMSSDGRTISFYER
jgi:hypothetical protein